MHYPEDFTADDIMEFEYEYNRHLDREDPNSLIAVNEELQLIANEEREMSVRDLIIDIQNDILAGVLNFSEIAFKHEVPLSWVNEAWDELCEQEAEAERFAGYHDELERDHDEPYEPDYGDSWYDDQYELDTDYA